MTVSRSCHRATALVCALLLFFQLLPVCALEAGNEAIALNAANTAPTDFEADLFYTVSFDQLAFLFESQKFTVRYNNGIDTGFVTSDEIIPITSGVKNGAALFNNPKASAYINGRQYNMPNGFTVGFWIKLLENTDASSRNIILPASSEGLFEIHIDSKNRPCFGIYPPDKTDYNADYILTGTEPLKNDRWYYITAVHKDKVSKLYINGTPCGTKNFDDNVTLNTSSYFYTAFGNYGSCLNGALDEFSVYSAAYSDAQITELYNREFESLNTWDFADYPGSTDSVDNVTHSAFRESRKYYPLDTDFEERSDVEESENSKLSELSQSGKFSLEINYPQASTPKIAIKKCQPFVVGNSESSPAVNAAMTSDNKLEISGEARADALVKLTLKDENDIQVLKRSVLTDENGNYLFSVNKPDDGTYSLTVEDYETAESAAATLTLGQNSAITSELTNTINASTNKIRLWIRPEQGTENISFYLSYDPEAMEKYIKITSDSNGDGIFEVGKELARGKWQEIVLDLTKTDVNTDNLFITGLWMSANSSSRWYFDAINSEYNELVTLETDLSDYACDNLSVSSDGSLSLTDDTESAVTSYAKYELSDKLYSLNFDIEMPNESSANDYIKIANTNSSAKISENGETVFYYDTATKKNMIARISGGKYITSVMPSAITSYSAFSSNGQYIFASNKLYKLTDNGSSVQLIDEFSADESGEYPFNSVLGVSNEGYVVGIKDGKIVDRNGRALAEENSTHGVVFSDDCKTMATYGYYLQMFKRFGNKLTDTYVQISDQVKLNEQDNSENKYHIFFDDSGKGFQLGHYRYDSGSANPIYMLTANDLLISRMFIGRGKDGKLLYKEIYKTKEYNSSSTYEVGRSLNMYDPVTGNHEKVELDNWFIDGNSTSADERIVYNSENDSYFYVNNNYDLYFNSGAKRDKLFKVLLSFDGGNRWYTYKNGWIEIAFGRQPTASEYIKQGMNTDELNAIPNTAFETLYQGDDTVSLDVGIRVSSTLANESPILRSFKIKTEKRDATAHIFASRYSGFEKSAYSELNGVYVSEHGHNTECYYFITLGDKWIYSYKNGSIFRIPGSVSELFSDVGSNWIKLKQCGMNASELRSIPAQKLNELCLNPDYGNSTFGIAIALKTSTASSADYDTDIKLSAISKQLAQNNGTLNIRLLDSTSITLTITAQNRHDAEAFLLWFDKCSRGINCGIFKLTISDKTYYLSYSNIAAVTSE